MIDDPSPAPTRPVTDPVARPVVLWLLATGLLFGASVLLAHDLTTSDQPHELVKIPWVVLLCLASLWPCLAAAVGLRRAWLAPAGIPQTWQRRTGLVTLAVLLLLTSLLDLGLLVFGVRALPAVLQGA